MRALIIGGTGMLAGTASALVAEGHEVWLPARHRPPVGRWIPADWTDPSAFTAAVHDQLGGSLDLLVIWCHRPYRAQVAPLLGPVVTDRTAIVEVVGSGQYRDTGIESLRHFPSSQLVVLGENNGRWLTHAEISEGVLAACHEPRSLRFVGSLPV